MRTTLTLDDDVAAKLKAEARRSGRPFRAIVNDTLRQGLATRRAAPTRRPFKVTARDLGKLLPGLTLDSVADLLEQVEGPLYR
jgi:plasmid stability protein